MIDLTVANDIDASPEAIWQALTDLSRYGDWNPFIREASGTPAVGAKLRVRVRSVLPFALVFRPTVLICDVGRELSWRGHFGMPWIASGEHSFRLEPAGPGRTRFVQREVFTGVLPRLVPRLLEREARGGFEAMNRALKARVEGSTPAPSPVASAAS